MTKSWTVMLLVALAAPAAAQDRTTGMAVADSVESEADPRWMATVHAGTFGIADDELSGVGMTTDAGTLFGARLGYRFKPRWAIEASYGYAALDGTSEGFGSVDGALHLYHADLVFLAPAAARAQVAVSAGVGGMRYAYDEFERRGVLLQDESWAHELVVSLGAGLVVNLGTRAGVRVEARDHVQFCSAEAEPIDETTDFSHCPLDDAVLHNPELSGGLLLRF
jgi:hypothetical protein